MAIPSLTLPQTNTGEFNTGSLLSGNTPSLNLSSQPTQTQATQTQTTQSPIPAQAPPSYQGIKGIFLNQDSPLNLQNDLGGLAMLGSDALAPITFGSSLAAAPILGAAGSAIGKGLENLLTGQSAGSGVGGAAVGGAVGGLGGEVIGGLVKPILGKLGDIASNSLTNKADGLGLAGLNIGSGAAKIWGANNKEALDAFLQRTGQLGATPESVTNTLNTMGDNYNALARNSNVTVPLSDLKAHLVQTIADQGNPVSSDGINFINKLTNESNNLLNNLPVDANGHVSIGDLANAKSEYQKLAYAGKAVNPSGINDVQQTLADSLMGKLNDVAPNSENGVNLAQIGQDFNKQASLDKLVQKNAYSSAASGKPITVGGLIKGSLSSGIGGLTAGPLGAAAGALTEPIIESIANNPDTMRIAAGAARNAAPVASNLLTGLGNAAGSTIGKVGIGESLMGLNSITQPAGIDPNAPTSQSQTTAQNSSDQNPLQTGVQALQSGNALDTAQYTALMDTMGINPNLGRWITSAYQAGNPAQTQATGRALDTITQLQNAYKAAGGAKGIVGGNILDSLGNLGIKNGSVKSYNDLKGAYAQEIISQLYPGGATADMQSKILNSIPDLNDNSGSSAQKFAALKATIANIMSSQQNATPTNVAAAAGPSLNLGQ